MNEQLQIIITATLDQFKREIQAGQEEIKKLLSETEKTSKGVDGLTNVLNEQEKQLKQLKNDYINVASASGSNSEEAQKYAQRIQDLSRELEANRKAFNKAAQEAEDFASAGRNAEKPVKSLKDKIKDFVKEGTKDFGALNDEFQKVGNVSKGVLKVMGGAIAGAAGALLALGETTREYRQQQAMLNTAFETAGGSAEVAKETYNDLYRVLGDSGQATEAAQHLAKLTTEEKALSEWTNICQGVYATFGQSLPIESLTEAVNHSAKLGEVQGSLADALEWSGINVDEFNEQLFWCNSESEREKLIRETLNGIYDEAAGNYEETNAQILAQNEAQTKLNDALAKIGEVMEPINTMFKELGAEILTDLTPYIQEFSEKYLPDIKDALEGVGEKIGKVISWIADNWELISTLAIVIAGISAALTILSTVMGIATTVQIAFSASMLPITLTVLAVTAAIAAIVTIVILVIKYWDELKAWTIKTWNAIVDAVKGAIDAVVNWFNNMKEKISNAVQAAKTAVVNKFNEIKTGIVTKAQEIWTGVTNTFNKVKDAIMKPVNSAKDAVKTAVDKIKGFFNFQWSLPKLKVPKFSIKPAGWSVGDLLDGVIPKLSVSWNARGGVFDKPTLFGYGNSLQGIGENGAEAVVPLENNLEWLNKLADMLSNRMGSGTPIVLQVDGKTFAKTAVSTINNLTRQTGKLPLNIV